MLGEVSNSRAAQKREGSVEGLGCFHLRLVGCLRHTIFRALSDAPINVANGHDLVLLRSSPIFEQLGNCLLRPAYGLAPIQIKETRARRREFVRTLERAELAHCKEEQKIEGSGNQASAILFGASANAYPTVGALGANST